MVVMMGAAMSPRMIPAFRTFRPTGTSKSVDDDAVHDAEADEAPDHGRDGREELHQDLQGLPEFPLGELPDEDGRAQGEGHGHQHGQPRHRGGTERSGPAHRRSGCSREVGRQAGEPKNSFTSRVCRMNPMPSFVMKTKIPRMKTMAETPPTNTKAAMPLS